jgi:hypothetical protein
LPSKSCLFRGWITVKAVYLFGILSTSPGVQDQRNDNGCYWWWPSHPQEAVVSESSKKVEMNFCRVLTLNRCAINQAFENWPVMCSVQTLGSWGWNLPDHRSKLMTKQKLSKSLALGYCLVTLGWIKGGHHMVRPFEGLSSSSYTSQVGFPLTALTLD